VRSWRAAGAYNFPSLEPDLAETLSEPAVTR
jgi:hypothetical protein